MDGATTTYAVVRTPAFELLLADYRKAHRKIADDLAWLEGKLKLAPASLGDCVPQLQKLAHPVFKTRCKDSCCNIGQSGGWRIYYAVGEASRTVWLLFLHHKREYENPGVEFLLQKLERAFESSLKKSGGQEADV